MNRDTNPLLRLLTSSKALVVMAVVASALAAFFTHRATWGEASDLVKYVLGAWLVAQGTEDAARHFATSRKTTSVDVSATNPPTPSG
jgi:hypothetical protein